MSEGRKSIVFSKTAGAGEEGFFEKTIREDCTLERIEIWFPPGPEGTVHIVPTKVTVHNTEILLFNIDDEKKARDYIAGDDYAFKLYPSISLYKDEKIKVYYRNIDAINPHEFVIIIEVDELGGSGRVLSNGRF